MPISPYPGQQPTQQQQAQMFAASSGMIHHGLLNPSAAIYKGAGGGPDVHSQTSSNDGSSGSDRQQNMRVGRAVLPPAPVPSLSTLSQHIQVSSSVTGGGGSSSLAAGPSSLNQPNRLDELPQDLASSRQSFRIAMSQPFEFFVDNL
ncbi:unnamed protein product [Anisakis simplex]|uniref:Uncharacterized protein n=1 Tax=Anisakis simplex TaxID=6269 RepID=A0A0M3J2F5_ANISI|nr:unnamed protein product [Anisakis simplex]